VLWCSADHTLKTSALGKSKILPLPIRFTLKLRTYVAKNYYAYGVYLAVNITLVSMFARLWFYS